MDGPGRTPIRPQGPQGLDMWTARAGQPTCPHIHRADDEFFLTQPRPSAEEGRDAAPPVSGEPRGKSSAFGRLSSLGVSCPDGHFWPPESPRSVFTDVSYVTPGYGSSMASGAILPRFPVVASKPTGRFSTLSGVASGACPESRTARPGRAWRSVPL